jgi:hypothetical protein
MTDRILWHSPHLFAAALLAALGVLALVGWLYPPQVTRFHSRWRWLLPGLRIAALLALAVSILRPVVVRPKTSRELGAVVLLVDTSRSMSVKDTGRSKAQLVALADGLGMIPRDLRRRPAIDVAAARETLRNVTHELLLARGELDYAKISGQSTAAAEQHVADTARKARDLARQVEPLPRAARQASRLADLADDSAMPSDEWGREIGAVSDRLAAALNQAQSSADGALYESDERVRAAVDELSAASRFDLAARALTEPRRGLLDAMRRDAPLFGFAFGDQVAAIPLRDGSGTLRRLPVDPVAARTDLTGALRAVREKMQGQPVQGVVVFSDGRQVGGEAGQLQAAIAGIGVPIYPVLVGAAVRRDVSLSSLQSPLSAFVGQMLPIRAEVRSSGYAGKSATVRLKVSGSAQPEQPQQTQQTQQTQQVTLSDEQPVAVQFSVSLTTAGVQSIQLAVDPLPDEASTENNSAARIVKVIAQKLKVALIAGAPTWDFQYLRNALNRSKTVEQFDQILADSAARLSLNPQQILEQDVLVLAGISERALSPEQWHAAQKLVSERGGSIIIIPGENRDMEQLLANPSIAPLLPFKDVHDVAWRIWPGDDPYFHLLPVPGEPADVLRLADDPNLDRQRWGELPPMFRYMGVPDAKPNVRALLVERDSSTPVLTQQRVGLGRAIFCGANETWRWRYNVGERDQDRFWLQLIRSAAEDPYAVSAGSVAFDVDPLGAEPGESVRVRARVTGATTQPASKPPTLQITRGGQVVRTQALPAAAPNSGRFAAAISDLPAGEYQLKLTAAGLPQPLTLPLRLAESAEAELANLSPDEGRLRRIATGSGGELMRIENAQDLPAKFRASRDRAPAFVELPLWDSPYLFGFVIGCLGLEWGLRKRLGLA